VHRCGPCSPTGRRSASTRIAPTSRARRASAVDEAPEGLAHTGDPVFCRPWSLLGLPCVHLPFARGESGLPVGLQLVGRHGADDRLLAAAGWAMARLGDG